MSADKAARFWAVALTLPWLSAVALDAKPGAALWQKFACKLHPLGGTGETVGPDARGIVVACYRDDCVASGNITGEHFAS